MRSYKRVKKGLAPLWDIWKLWDYHTDIFAVQDRLARCGTSELVRACYDCGTETVHPLYCSCRLCHSQECEKSRRKRLFARYANMVELFVDPHFLTLTYQGHHELDYTVIRRMEYAFKQMLQQGKRDKTLPKFQYIRIVEIVPKDDGLFYYHFHLLVDRMLDAEVLRGYWERYASSTQLYIEWLTGAPSLRRTLNYLLKYIIKNMTLQCLDVVSYLEKHFYRHRLIACSVCKEISYINRNVGDYCPYCGQKHYQAIGARGSMADTFFGAKTDRNIMLT